MGKIELSWTADDQHQRSRMPSPKLLAWRRLRRHKLALAGIAILVGLALFVTVGARLFARGTCIGTGNSRYLTGVDYANCSDTKLVLQPPSRDHPFGTDTAGRDLLARCIYGGRISLAIGLFAALAAVTLGTLIGIVSGYYRGWIDSGLMRFTEAMLSIPQLFLLLVAVKFLDGKIGDVHLFGRSYNGSVLMIILVLALTSWMALARIVRATTLSLKERDFVLAARAIGVPDLRIMGRYILPNTSGPIIVATTLFVAGAILSEAYISYLGLGVRPPTASWGNMLDRADGYIDSAPWFWMFPGVLILLTVLSINFVGDGLRDALDPRHQR